MEENKLCDYLPQPVVIMLDHFFNAGKCVNDFKLTGNSHGYSLTLHIADTPLHPPEWSPGSRKSKSTCHHDHQRRNLWLSEFASTERENEHSRLQQSNYNMNTESESTSIYKCNAEVNTEEIANVNKSAETKDQHVQVYMEVQTTTCEQSSQCEANVSLESIDDSDDDILNNTMLSDAEPTEPTTNDTYDNSKISTNEQVFSNTFSDTSNDHKSYSDQISVNVNNTYKSKPEHEMLYHKNILDNSRNKVFSKIVHDMREGHSVVNGKSQDIVIS